MAIPLDRMGIFGMNNSNVNHRKESQDIPWLLAFFFLVGFTTDTLPRYDKQEGGGKPPESITQLEVNLSTKESGLFMVFDNGELFSQGSFKNTRDLTSQINNIDKGYIDTDNLELSIGDLNRFKNNLNITNMRVYHVR
jgi:hypothetical protein